MMSSVLWHVAQSSLFAFIVLLLTLMFRQRAAAVRHRLWVAAGLKFAVPFSWFATLGSVVGEHFSVAPVRLHLLYGAALQGIGAQAAPVQRMPWVPVASLVCWLVVTAVLLIAWVRRFESSIGETASACPIEEETLRWCSERMGLGTVPRLRVASKSQGPCVRGVLHPVIVVPQGISKRLDSQAFEAVLLHELAHVKRKDNLWAMAVHAVSCVFWFYPVPWWIERRVRGEAELACDALVLEAGAPREAYLSGLMEVCRMSLLEPVAGSSPIGGVNLQERLERIMSNRIEGKTPQIVSRLGGALLAGGCGLAFVLGVVGSRNGVAQTAGRNGAASAADVNGCAAGQPEPFAVGTVIRHMPRQQLQVCVLEGKRPMWLTLAKGGVPSDVKVIDLQDPPPVFCKETAPQGKLCTCDGAAFSPGAVVDSSRGKLACPASGGRWQSYKGMKGPWPTVSLLP